MKTSMTPYRNVRISGELEWEKIDALGEILGWSLNKLVGECLTSFLEMCDTPPSKRVVPLLVERVDAMRRVSNKKPLSSASERERKSSAAPSQAADRATAEAAQSATAKRRKS